MAASGKQHAQTSTAIVAMDNSHAVLLLCLRAYKCYEQSSVATEIEECDFDWGGNTDKAN